MEIFLETDRLVLRKFTEDDVDNLFDLNSDPEVMHYLTKIGLLIREYARRFSSGFGPGRIVALTSDHTAGNLPYGASKGALDRIVIAASRELSHLGTRAVHFGRRGAISDQVPASACPRSAWPMTETRTYPGIVELESDIRHVF